MRVGTNHGSLSDRIMSRYGDTPIGMVESAMEFVRICEDHNFHDIVISMKASNPQVMVQAYRLLMQQMLESGEIYPLHLGVTEAGEGEDGRIKSALGIATLLMDGIGDTVRVSLTEEPEYETPVAQFLVNHYVEQANKSRVQPTERESIALPFDPYSFKKRKADELVNIGGDQVPRVVADIRHKNAEASDLSEIGYQYVALLDKYNFSDIAADFAYMGNSMPIYNVPGGLKCVYDHEFWKLLNEQAKSYPYFKSATDFLQADEKHDSLNFVKITEAQTSDVISSGKQFENCCFIIEALEALPIYEWRSTIYQLIHAGLKNPFMISMNVAEDFAYYSDAQLAAHLQMNRDAKIQLALAANGSSLLVDGLIDGIWLQKADDCKLRTAFGMLQLSRLRITKTEYISCPSCGRTLFDLQETTARIRKRTEHLKGVKIGIMAAL